MPENILEIQNLSIAFNNEGKESIVLKDINIHVKKGEIVGIVGESGSGKSVSSLSVLQLLPKGISQIKNGSILYHNPDNGTQNLINVPNINMFRGNKISMVFQEPMTSLNPVHKCGRQVQEILLIHKKTNKQVGKKHVLQLFEEVKLPNPQRIYNAYPHQLSGGQRQRVMIAMALACKPDILIADEPTTALDVTVQKSVLNLLKELQAKYAMSIIFISHDLELMAQIADSVYVMRHGEIVEFGDVATIFKEPKHPYTKGLLACKAPLDKRPLKLMTVEDFINNTIAIDNENNNERAERLALLYDNKVLIKTNTINKSYTTQRTLLGKTKSSVHVLKNIDLEIFQGEILGLVGESGCGKSTLGRALLKLIDIDSGNIFFKDQNLNRFSKKELKKFRQAVQIIFQDPYSSLNPKIKIGKAILEVMRVHKILGTDTLRKEWIYELMRKVNLDESYFDRYPHQLSGGQRQRICIARALATKPELIICDEAVSALDVSVQAQVINLLKQIQKEFNLTLLFISHDLSVVKYISDRIAVMNQGLIVEIQESDSLYRNPQSPYTKQLIEAMPGANRIMTQ